MMFEWNGGHVTVLLSKLLKALDKEELWIAQLPDLQALAIGASTEECRTKMGMVEELMNVAVMHKEGWKRTRETIGELYEKSTPPCKEEALSNSFSPMKWRIDAIHNQLKCFIIGCRNANIALEGTILGEEYIKTVHSEIDSMKDLRLTINSAPYEYDRTLVDPILQDLRRFLAQFEKFEAAMESLNEKATSCLIIEHNRFTEKRVIPGAINENSLKMNRAIETAGDRLKREFERLEKVVRDKTVKIIESHINVGSCLPGYQFPVPLISLINSQIAKERKWMNDNENRFCFPDFDSFLHDCLHDDQNGEIKIAEASRKFQHEYTLEVEQKLPLIKTLCSAIEKICRRQDINESLRRQITTFSNQFEVYWTTFEKRKEEVVEFERLVNALNFVLDARRLEKEYDEVIGTLAPVPANTEESRDRHHGQYHAETSLTMELFQLKASKAAVDMTGTEKFDVYKKLMNKTELTGHEQQIEKIVFECNLTNVQKEFVDQLRVCFPGIYCIDANRRNDALQKILNILKTKADQSVELISDAAFKRRLSKRPVREEESDTETNPSLREKRAKHD